MLQETLESLIAKIHEVKNEDVTPEFIRKKRNELYAQPNHRFIDTPNGLPAQNQSEIEKEGVAANRFLSSFRR